MTDQFETTNAWFDEYLATITEEVEGDRRALWFPTWREAYAYADAMARAV